MDDNDGDTHSAQLEEPGLDLFPFLGIVLEYAAKEAGKVIEDEQVSIGVAADQNERSLGSCFGEVERTQAQVKKALMVDNQQVFQGRFEHPDEAVLEIA